MKSLLWIHKWSSASSSSINLLMVMILMILLAARSSEAKLNCEYTGLGAGGFSPLSYECSATCQLDSSGPSGLQDAASFIKDDLLPVSALVYSLGNVNNQQLNLYSLLTILRSIDNPFCVIRSDVFVYLTYVSKPIEVVQNILNLVKKVPIIKGKAAKIERGWKPISIIAKIDDKLEEKCNQFKVFDTKYIEKILSLLSSIIYYYKTVEPLIMNSLYEALCGINNDIAAFERFADNFKRRLRQRQRARSLQLGEPEEADTAADLLTAEEIHESFREALSEVQDPNAVHVLKKWYILRADKIRNTPIDQIEVKVNAMSNGRRLGLVNSFDSTDMDAAIAKLESFVNSFQQMDETLGALLTIVEEAKDYIDVLFADNGFLVILGTILEPLFPVFDIFDEVAQALEFIQCPKELGFICDLDTIIEGFIEDLLKSIGIDVDAIIDFFIGTLIDFLEEIGLPTPDTVDANLPDLADLPLLENFEETYIEPMQALLGDFVSSLDFDPVEQFFDRSGNTDVTVGSDAFEFLYSTADAETTTVECTSPDFPVVLKAWRRTAACEYDVFTPKVVTPCGSDGSVASCEVDGALYGSADCSDERDVSGIPGVDTAADLNRVSAYYICATATEFENLGLMPFYLTENDPDSLICGVGEQMTVQNAVAKDPCDYRRTESGWGAEWSRWCDNKYLEESLPGNSNYESIFEFFIAVKESRDKLWDGIIPYAYANSRSNYWIIRTMSVLESPVYFPTQFRDVCNGQASDSYASAYGELPGMDGSESTTCDTYREKYLEFFFDIEPFPLPNGWDDLSDPNSVRSKFNRLGWYAWEDCCTTLVQVSKNPGRYWERGRNRWDGQYSNALNSESTCLDQYQTTCDENESCDVSGLTQCIAAFNSFPDGSQSITKHEISYSCLLDGRDISTPGVNNFIEVGFRDAAESNVVLECPEYGIVNVIKAEAGDGGFEDKTDVDIEWPEGAQSIVVDNAVLGVDNAVFRIEFDCSCVAPADPLFVYDQATDTYSCDPCPLGTYRADGMANCEACLAGTFSNTTYSSSCTDCPVGTYQPNVGNSTCVKCPEGTFNPSTKQTNEEACQLCPVDEYNDETGQETCKPTPAGTEAPRRGSAIYAEVARGFFSVEGGPALPCPVGTFSNTRGAANNCTPCAEGSFASQEGKEVCEPCPIDTYADSVANIICTFCAEGTGTAGLLGQTSVDSCVAPPPLVDYSTIELQSDDCETLLMLDIETDNSTVFDRILERRLGQIGNGICNKGGAWNTEQCDFDGGDCCPHTCTIPDDANETSVGILETLCSPSTFNCLDPAYAGTPYTRPDAQCDTENQTIIDNPSGTLGDGLCDPDLNNALNDFDGGDCCLGTCVKTADPASCEGILCACAAPTAAPTPFPTMERTESDDCTGLLGQGALFSPLCWVSFVVDAVLDALATVLGTIGFS